MHSSRMHTVHYSGCCREGGCLPGTVCLGGCLPGECTPAPVNRITDRCKNITFPQLCMWMVNISEFTHLNWITLPTPPPPVCLQGGGRVGHTLRPVNRITHRCKTLPCPKLRLWAVKIHKIHQYHMSAVILHLPCVSVLKCKPPNENKSINKNAFQYDEYRPQQ